MKSEETRKRGAAWKRAAIVSLCVGLLLLTLYAGTLLVERRRQATQDRIRALYHGSQTGTPAAPVE